MFVKGGGGSSSMGFVYYTVKVKFQIVKCHK